MKKTQMGSDMLEEYDFSNGETGKYAERYAKGSKVVVIDPDVAEFFPNNDAVNEALRLLVTAFPACRRSPRKNRF